MIIRNRCILSHGDEITLFDRSTRTKAANRRLHNREIESYVHPNTSANQSNKKAVNFSTAVFTWSGQRDSNPRPSPWQGDALPAEPCPHVRLSKLEATPGFEPGVKALQASALPLGHVAILASCLIKSWLIAQPAHLRQWSGQRDSNPRPSPWQGDALPAEPCPHHKWWALQDLNL